MIEFGVLKKLEKLDMAPKLIKSWPKLSVIAYRYIEGSRCLKNIQAIVELMKKKEKLNPAGFRKAYTDSKEIILE